MSFLIAGGGIAGLAAGLAVAGTGREAVIHEQAEAFEEVGAGLQLGPNGVKALAALGAWDHVEPHCFAPPAIHVRDGRTGRTLNRILLKSFAERFGAPYRVIHRADLLKGLLAAARKNPRLLLRTSSRVTGFEPGLLRFETGASAPFTALIGADGIRSTIRRALLNDGEPRHAGQMIARALVPVSQIAAAGPQVTLWLCPGGHVVHYPVAAGRSMNLVAAFDSPAHGEGWGGELPREALMAAFPDICVDLHYALGVPQDWRQWAGATRPAARKWGEANVTLIGDAAHPMLPYLAQGAVMALEDAATLKAWLAREAEPARAFRHYEMARMPRTARVMAASNGLSRIYHARGLIRRARDLVITNMPQRLSLSRMAMLYDWVPPA